MTIEELRAISRKHDAITHFITEYGKTTDANPREVELTLLAFVGLMRATRRKDPNTDEILEPVDLSYDFGIKSNFPRDAD
jgi:hypothetical protein